jgi:hypothetical protein
MQPTLHPDTYIKNIVSSIPPRKFFAIVNYNIQMCRKPKEKGSCLKSALALIELLFVMVTVAIPAAILLPTLTAAKFADA